MPWDAMSSITELMPHTIQLLKLGGYDRYGQPVYSGSSMVQCLITGKQQLVRATDGTQQMTSSVIYCYSPELEITAEDRVAFPDGRQFSILAVATDTDEKGIPYSVTVYLGA